MPKRGPGSPNEDHVNRRFGERLRACRERAGKSQTDIGNALGVSFQQIQKYENGTTSISLNRIFDFADTIGISMSRLFDGLDARDFHGLARIGFAEERQAPISGDDHEDMHIAAGPQSKQKVRLIAAFNRINDAKARMTLIEMAEALAPKQNADDV